MPVQLPSRKISGSLQLQKYSDGANVFGSQLTKDCTLASDVVHDPEPNCHTLRGCSCGGLSKGYVSMKSHTECGQASGHKDFGVISPIN